MTVRNRTIYTRACQRWVLLLALCHVWPIMAWAGGNLSAAPCDETALRLGAQVSAVAEAIRDPDSPDAMAAIVELGTDSRYYTMVRGWLMLVAQGDQSILAASEPGSRPAIEERLAFLQRAIRAIDLE